MTAITTLTPEQLAEVKALAAEGNDLNQRVKAMQERIDAIRRELAALLPAGSYTEYGVEVRNPNRSFSDELAKEILPTDLYRSLLVERVDRKRAKEILPDELYQALMTPPPADKERTVAFK